MGLLLAPYNNAMRLGQGFNSFTQQICIDDAVVVNPNRAENILTNDGNTMRLTALVKEAASAWTKQETVLIDTEQYETAKRVRLEEEANQTEKEIQQLEEKLDESSGNTSPNTQNMLTGEGTHTGQQNEDPVNDVKKGDDFVQQSLSPQPGLEEPEKDDSAGSTPIDNASKAIEIIEDISGDNTNNKEAGSEDQKVDEPLEKEDDADHTSNQIENTAISASGSVALIEGDGNSAPNGQPDIKTDDPKDTDEKSEIETNKLTEEPEKLINDSEKNGTEDTDSGKVAAKQLEEGEKELEKKDLIVNVGGKDAEEAVVSDKEEDTDEEPKLSAEDERKMHLDQLKRLRENKIRVENEMEANGRAIKAAKEFAIPDLTLEQMAKDQRNKILPTKLKYPGMSDGHQTQTFEIKNSHGVSQTVIYRSHFIDKLSDVANDMGLSAALSIKGDSFAVGGRGSFIKTDKFKDSDLNFYISVKVINQSINFKDALEYNKLDNIADEEFRDIYGDTFISGFLEGGELNALISMKILNKTNASSLAIGGSLGVTGDTWSVDGSGAFAMAKTNLDLNTETTVSVSWLGGGNIKPPNEAWTIESLTRAATRFPDMVAESPQRTYAILTKYESLRSFQLLKPMQLLPIDYENASLYTNELLDLFVSYKALYTRLTKQISAFQNGTLKFKVIDKEKRPTLKKKDGKLENLDDEEKKGRIGYFNDKLDGLDAARRAVRTQMNLIVARVVDITKRPEKVLLNPKEAFLPIFSFETLLPPLESAFKPKSGGPLSNERMFDFEEESKGADDVPDTGYGSMKEASRLCLIRQADQIEGGLRLFKNETNAIEKYLASHDEGIEDSIRLTALFGNDSKCIGSFFSTLDFLKPDFLIKQVTITMNDNIITSLSCRYTNGLSWRKGHSIKRSDAAVETSNQITLSLGEDERITSLIITVGAQGSTKSARESILGIQIVTNKGSNTQLQGKSRRVGFQKRMYGQNLFSNVRSITFESPLERCYLCGFWGRTSSDGNLNEIIRLGGVWGNKAPSSSQKAIKMNLESTKGKEDEARKADEHGEQTLNKEDELKYENILLQNRKRDLEERLQKETSNNEELRSTLQGKLDEAVKELDQLNKNIKAELEVKRTLTTEKYSLLLSKSGLESKAEKLQSTISGLNKEKEDLSSEKEKMVKERDELKSKKEGVEEKLSGCEKIVEITRIRRIKTPYNDKSLDLWADGTYCERL